MTTYLTFNFLRASTVYHSFVRLQPLLVPDACCNRVQQKVIRLLMLALSFIAVFGFSVMTLERAGDLDGFAVVVGGANVDGFTAFNALYYALTSSTTVGCE